jgi:hypothetical protein
MLVMTNFASDKRFGLFDKGQQLLEGNTAAGGE